MLLDVILLDVGLPDMVNVFLLAVVLQNILCAGRGVARRLVLLAIWSCWTFGDAGRGVAGVVLLYAALLDLT